MFQQKQEEGKEAKLPMPEIPKIRDYSKEIEDVLKSAKVPNEVKEHIDNLITALKNSNNKLTDEEKSYVHIVCASIEMCKEKLDIPAKFFKICLDLDSSETGKTKLLFMFARNRNIAVSGEYAEVIKEVINGAPTDPFYYLVSQRSDLKIQNFQLPDNYEILSKQFLEEKADLFLRQVSIFVLAHREDIELPKNILDDLTKMRSLVYQKKSTDLENQISNDKSKNLSKEEKKSQVEAMMVGSIDIFGFEQVVLMLLGQREIPGAIKFVRENYGVGNTLRGRALVRIANSKSLLSEYSVADIIKDRGYPGLDKLDDKLEDRVVSMSPQGNYLLKSDDQYMIWERECFRGNDHLLANLLAKKISTLKESKLTEAQLSQIAHPLINYLSELRNFNPEKWDQIARQNPELVDKVALDLSRKIFRERTRLEKGELDYANVFSPSKQLICLLHPAFHKDSVIQLGNHYRMDMGGDRK